MIGALLQQKGFDKEIAGEDFDVAVRAVTEAVNGYRGLFLTGGCGCGKTHLLKTLFNGFSFSGQKYWIDCGDPASVWLLDIRANSRIRELYDTYLFIDDLGTEVKVEYGRRTDFVGEFIREYHNRGRRKLFISTNLCGKDMLDKYDERIVDRIMEMCVVGKFNGLSHRERKVVK